MSELRQRNTTNPDDLKGDLKPNETGPVDTDSEASESEVPGIGSDAETVESKATSAPLPIPQGTDLTPQILDSVTKNMPQKWKNWTIRFIFGFCMIIGFVYIMYLGPIALVLLVFGIEMKCFSEIITIGYVVYKSQNLPWFRTLSWYFLLTANYYIFGETTIDQLGVLVHKTDLMRPLLTYHRFIAFSLYLAGVIGFICSLKKRYYLRQFTLFGYTHVTLLIVATGANFLIRNIFEGVFWFFLSTSMIICNDIWAYIFGFFIGKTPLIKLSPKKTLEGYLGGGLATLVYAAVISNVMVHYDHLVCPVEYLDDCVRNPVFVPYNYTLPKTLQTFSSLIGRPMMQVSMYPITFHALFLATFASLIGPFGGFFASGFKRAFKIKDFGDIFPGHGGFMDRFDCQILMGAFMYTYVSTFIRVPNPQKLMATIDALQPEDQLTVLHRLCETLQAKGLANCSNLGVS